MKEMMEQMQEEAKAQEAEGGGNQKKLNITLEQQEGKMEDRK